MNRSKIRHLISKENTTKKKPSQNGFTTENFQAFNEKLTPAVYKLFQKQK